MKRICIAALALLLVSSFAHAAVEQTFIFQRRDLTVTNLVGEVKVVPGDGDNFRVLVAIKGEDAVEGLLEIVTEEGKSAELAVIFPLDEHDDYLYPPLGRNAKSTISYRDGQSEERSWLKKVFQSMVGQRVTVRGKGKGLAVWADLTIEVPAGRFLEIKHGVGTIVAEQVTGDLKLDISSGSITANDITGDLGVDTGSGAVEVARVQGDLHVDTGSGYVEVSECRGDKVIVDTGSGSVEAMGVVCGRLHIDTGSGKVRARGVTADRALIDTGSGSVTLHLDGMGPGSFVIDTGSGSIELMLPADASADIRADTGSGGIKNRVDEAEVRLLSRDELAMVVGDGEAKVRLDAGSGSITIRQK